MSSRASRTKTGDGTLVDPVQQSPVDRVIARFRKRFLLVLLLLIILAIVIRLVVRFTADKPIEHAAIEEHYKYGSIGSEPGGSLTDAMGGLLPPFWIFKALPEVCPDKLPGGYASLGLIIEEGHDLPIGVSRRKRLGFDQVGLNCAVCHTGTYRDSPDGDPKIVLGMPAHSLDLQALFAFVIDCSLDPRFTPDNVVGTIQEIGGDLGWLDRLLYRTQVVPRTREATMEQHILLSRLLGDEVTPWGLGRVDTFNPYKAIQFNWNLDQLPASELSAASDYPSIWNQKPRDAMQLHWDGNNNSVDERNLSASLGTGVTPVTIDHEGLQRVRDWIWDLPPPEYPYPIDEAMAARGESLYAQYCGSCHDFDGSHVGTVVPIQEVQTDRQRLDSYTAFFAANQYTLYPDSKYRFRHFRKTNGYANHPLDAIWLKAPYLHNGAVPTLRDLMNPPEDRPKVFYRGYDVFDQDNVGFVTTVAEENGRQYSVHDVSRLGNGNAGHLYGVYLSDAEKDAIVEYMKTL